MRLSIALLLLASACPARAAEFHPEGQRFVVEMRACLDKTHRCEVFRRPVDTEGMLCEFGMMKSEVEWSREHPDYRVVEYHCARAEEIGI